MRILLATTSVPFVRGGAEVLTAQLTWALREAGHVVDELILPFHSDPDTMLEQMLALRLTDIADQGDVLLCLRTPSYLLRHPRKRVWFIHHHRAAYDLWNTPLCDIPNTQAGRAVRDAIRGADDVALREAEKVLAISPVVARRISDGNGLIVPVLNPPILGIERFRSGPAGDYILAPGRITGVKRQHLLAEAMQHVRSGVRLLIAGPADAGAELERLQRAVQAAPPGLVELRAGWLEDAELIELYAGCLAVAHVPLGEDSTSYVVAEASASGKPTITCSDSGGTTEFAEEGNVLVAEPTPEAIAVEIDRLAEDRALADRTGAAARATLERVNSTWPEVVERLLA